MQLHAPVIGKLNQKICTARFARTLSNLYSSGVPIVATLIASRDAVGNRWIISQFDEVLDKVRAGNSLSESLALVDGFEQSMSSSIAVGEETGKLDELLATISETLDFEAEVATKRLVTLLEPIMIVIMGLIVAFVVVAVILPIYQSYGTIRAVEFDVLIFCFSLYGRLSVTGHPAGRLRLPFAGTLRPLPRLNSILLFMCSFWNPKRNRKGSRYFR